MTICTKCIINLDGELSLFPTIERLEPIITLCNDCKKEVIENELRKKNYLKGIVRKKTR